MMLELILVRHGETAWNAERRLQGHLDIGLNDIGLRQAAACGQYLAHEPLDAIYASDLQRAQQTASALAAPHGLPIQTDTGLRERCFGGFEGKLYSELEALFPTSNAAMLERDLDARYPDGVHRAETLREFDQRVMQTLNAILTDNPARRIAIVSHGGVLDCVYRRVRGLRLDSPRDFDVKNASINRFQWRDAALHLSHWGEVAHLAHLGEAVLDEANR